MGDGKGSPNGAKSAAGLRVTRAETAAAIIKITTAVIVAAAIAVAAVHIEPAAKLHASPSAPTTTTRSTGTKVRCAIVLGVGGMQIKRAAIGGFQNAGYQRQ